MKKYRSNLVFKTEKQHSKIKTRNFVALLAAVLVLGGSISVLLFMRNYNFDLHSAFYAREEKTGEETTESAVSVQQKKRSDFLFYCTSADKKSMAFLCLVRMAVPENGVGILCLSPEESAEVDGEVKTLAAHYYSGGAPELLKAVEASTGIKPDRYAGSTEAKFRLIINNYGGVTVPVSTPVQYKGNDFRLILTKGAPLMKGDTLIKYLRWHITGENALLEEQAGVLGEIFSAFLCPERAEKASSVFSYLANQLETDISIVDFASASDWLTSMAGSGSVSCRAAESPEEFCGMFEE